MLRLDGKCIGGDIIWNDHGGIRRLSDKGGGRVEEVRPLAGSDSSDDVPRVVRADTCAVVDVTRPDGN